jgi:Tfp pilus assembly protein PilE
MSAKSESRRLWRTALVVAAVGVVVLVPLAWLAVRMYNDSIQQKVIAADDLSARDALKNIQAAEQLYYESNGEYATFPQLVEAGVFQTKQTGDALVNGGYKFTLRVTPKADTQGPAYSVNADPVRAGGRDATGRRHYFISSEVAGVRYNEERPATAADKPWLTGTEY